MADVPVGEPGAFSRFFTKVSTRSSEISRSYLSSNVHASGMRVLKNELTFGNKARAEIAKMGKMGSLMKWGSRALWVGGIAHGIYEDGIRGGVKAGAQALAFSYGLGAAMPILAGAGVVAGGAAYGALAGIGFASMSEGVSPLQLLTRRRVREHMRKNARIDMGAPVNDPHGNLATMRQRSLSAMQNSRLSGMNALGYEAQINYSRYQVRR